jgi:hypothetical protein
MIVRAGANKFILNESFRRAVISARRITGLPWPSPRTNAGQTTRARPASLDL